jgi:predicted ATP-grasp superfamily ATP-dependent carboligase
MDALVTDAHTRWSLAGIRGLGRAGLRVAALAPRRAGAGRWSRYAALREVGPHALADPAGYVGRVTEIAGRHGPLVVYPGDERAIDLLLAQPLPPEAILPYPPKEVTQRVRDKRELSKLADASGLTAPRTRAQGTAADLLAAPAQAPCAIKAARRGGKLNKTLLARSAAELRAILAGLPGDEELLVQELLDGPLTGVAVVIDRAGAVVARFQQVAQRVWPTNAGGSALAASVAPDEQLVERSGRMLADIGYWGLAQLQFIQGANGPALIDVNTRHYGSLPLALAAGVNLPAAWHAVALGQNLQQPGPYRVGVTYRWLEAEAAAAYRGSWRILVDRAPKPRAGAVWAGDDPLPSAVLTLEAVAAKLRNRVPGGRG